MRTCDTCETEKPDPQFRVFGRGRKKTCIECEGGGSVKAKNTKTEPAPEPIKLDGLSLEVARGYGFRASAEDGALAIEQDTEDGEGFARIVLSKTEFKVLAAQFGEWCRS